MDGVDVPYRRRLPAGRRARREAARDEVGDGRWVTVYTY